MIAIFGAGAIGCWFGGRLAAGGADVTLIGRARVMDELAGGLHVTELDGGHDVTVSPTVATEAAAAANAELVLVTVKSHQTAEAGAELAAVLPESTVVVSLQNGVRNVDALRAALPGRQVVAAMVVFNIVRRGPGAYHRASDGTLCIDDHPAAAPFLDACRTADLPIEPRRDMDAVLWAKLVLNLNNAINALSGEPIAAELAQRDFRLCLSAAQREALDVLAAANIDVARLTAVPTRWLPRLLALPDPVFRLLGSRVGAIDPTARSSMSGDLEARRATEIDYVQGEIVTLAEQHGKDAPINRELMRLVHDAEAGGKQDFGGKELRSALGV